MENELEKLEKQGVFLGEREKSQLKLYETSKEAHIGLSVQTAAKMFALFLQGYSCEDIQKLNPGIKLGLIVRTRIDQRWDKHKAEHIEQLMAGARETVLKTQLEGIRFAADGMAVHQRLLGTAFAKYLQSGDEEDLGVFKDQVNIRNYKEFVALLMQLSGQGKDGTAVAPAPPTPATNEVWSEKDVAQVSGSDILEKLDK